MLPFSTQDRLGLSLIDAFFTSTSAACVTGLTVVDVHNELSLFGIIVLAIVIQIGGLGMMTLGVLAALALSRQVRLRERLVLQESLNQDDTGGVVRMTSKIIQYTLVIETAFALMFAFHFYERYGWAALGYGIFHSIASFCNAGFDLFGNYESMMGFAQDDFLLNSTALLIILGGLGFTVLDDLYHQHHWSKLCLQTKVVLTTTVVLLVLGTILIFTVETSNPATLGKMTFWQQLENSFFTSVSTRTAGFNTFDLGAAHGVTLVVLCILMFIGASPASTGGGIKTTTLAVILLMVSAVLHGRKDNVVFGRTLTTKLQAKATTVFVLAIVWITLAFLVLAVTDNGNHPLLFMLFEVVSAFATVGLSTGITLEWDILGKLILIATMFVGRVGILTFMLSLLEQKEERIKYPSENIMIG